MPQTRIPTLARFESKVRKSQEPDGCWEWIGAKDKDGYGLFWDGTYSPNGRGHMVRVTRWVFERHVSSLPGNMNVCHTCDTPSCVRPSHLFAGSHKDNHADREAKGRGGQWMTRGEGHGANKLTTKQVLEIRARYAPHKVTIPQLAQEFGVSRGQIENVIYRKAWKHV